MNSWTSFSSIPSLLWVANIEHTIWHIILITYQKSIIWSVPEEACLTMEEVCQRFPLIAQKIWNQVDNETLINFKEAGRTYDAFLEKRDSIGLEKSIGTVDSLENSKKSGRKLSGELPLKS